VPAKHSASAERFVHAASAAGHAMPAALVSVLVRGRHAAVAPLRLNGCLRATSHPRPGREPEIHESSAGSQAGSHRRIPLSGAPGRGIPAWCKTVDLAWHATCRNKLFWQLLMRISPRPDTSPPASVQRLAALFGAE
jgi:hypothetical protein